MSKSKNLHSMIGIAALAMMFGAASSYAQSATDSATGAAGTASEKAADQMSPSSPGASSAAPATSGASGTAGSSAAGATLSKSDQNLMKELAYANMAEIQAGQVAQEKSQNEQVKTFAQKMIDDHTKAQDQLQQLAQAKGVTLPDQLDKKHKTEVDKLSALTGDKFDKQYTTQGGVSDHRKTHALLSRIEKRAKDQELKTLASNLMPTINEHLQMAKALKSGKSTATGSSGTAGSSSSATPSGTSTAPETSGSSGTSGMSSPSGAGAAGSTGSSGTSGMSSPSGAGTTSGGTGSSK